ncbi:MAG: NUDIX domain-containing protein [Gracilimonas sp.]|jgi:8-oxo-dGTP pyrophosphatase MutT (NUDIX family)|nr:NUDIX domain-containing protein [Gracilimonas sp.]
MSKTDIEPIIAAGGVVFRISNQKNEPDVLMIYRNGVWDLPKGKLEEGESIAMCAVREVAEEVGSRLPTIVNQLQSSYHEYQEGETKFGKTTYWYSMIFTSHEDLKPQKEEGIEEIKWFSVSEGKKMAGYSNLVDVLRDFEE